MDWKCHDSQTVLQMKEGMMDLQQFADAPHTAEGAMGKCYISYPESGSVTQSLGLGLISGAADDPSSIDLLP